MRSQTKRKEERGLYLYYLYCFFLAGKPFSLQEKGMDGENNVFSLSYCDLSTLVSCVPLNEYSEEALEESMGDLKWITPRVKHHEQIIKAAMKFGPVIPVRFCTLYKSRERVLEVSKSHYEDFRAFLGFVQDKEEWGVKVYMNKGAVEKLVQKACPEEAGRRLTADRCQGTGGLRSAVRGLPCRRLSPALQALDDRISSASTGESYFLKKRRERILREEVERILDKLTEGIYTKISSWSVAGQRNRLLDRQATGRNEEMILNAAFLLDKNKVGEFVEWLGWLASGYEGQGLFFEVSGPWPPYNFCPQVNYHPHPGPPPSRGREV